MTATQGLGSDRFCLLVPAAGLYVGHAARASVRGRARRQGAHGCACGPGSRRLREGERYRRQADGCNRGVGPRRMAYRQSDPDWSAARRNRAVARPPKEADPGLDSAAGLLDIPSPSREGLNSGVEYFDFPRYQSHGRPGTGRAACLPLR